MRIQYLTILEDPTATCFVYYETLYTEFLSEFVKTTVEDFLNNYSSKGRWKREGSGCRSKPTGELSHLGL